MAQRILGMGDIVSLVERAQEQFDETEAKRSKRRLNKISSTLMTFNSNCNKSKRWVILKAYWV